MPDGRRQQLETWHLLWLSQTFFLKKKFMQIASGEELLVEDLLWEGRGSWQGALQERESKRGRCSPSHRSSSCPSQSCSPHLTPPESPTGWAGVFLCQHWPGKSLIHTLPSLPLAVQCCPQREGSVRQVRRQRTFSLTEELFVGVPPPILLTRLQCLWCCQEWSCTGRRRRRRRRILQSQPPPHPHYPMLPIWRQFQRMSLKNWKEDDLRADWVR